MCQKQDIIKFAIADFQGQNLVVLLVLVAVVECKSPLFVVNLNFSSIQATRQGEYGASCSKLG